MAFSVNTNVGAMVALQELNRTSKGLSTTESRISSGKNVNSTRDDSATFVTAQGLRGKQGDLKAVTSSLSNAKSVVDIAVSGTEQISDIVNEMKTLAKQAGDTTISATQRDSLNKDFIGLRERIKTIVNTSEYNDKNLLKMATTDTVTPLQSLANVNPTPASAFTPDTMTITGSGLGLPKAADAAAAFNDSTELTDAATAATVDGYLSTYKTTVNNALSNLGTAARRIDSQLTFTSKLADTIEAGIGNLVDADMAKESARLTALQTKQQLGVQALSIANQSPQMIGQLFKG
ncbi:flagellin [Sphingomonas sp. S-NIH.Pt15_0812]|jgi:flagellin|nr:flagellin [Sphingomonas sp. S-NIH.Pt15_0812]RSU47028.1 flagellin [Sphingomonas sp. S-NIH.Pt15_0812]